VAQPDDHQFILKQPCFAYAVRLKYSYQPRAPTAQFRFTWKPKAEAEPASQMEIPLLQAPGENSLLVWINGPVERFAIFPDNKPYSCTLWDIELLVPADPTPGGP
jgi:hypothetical protein